MRYRFGDYELDLPQHELRVRNEALGLQPQLFQLLRYLIEARDRVVTKQELLEVIWGATAVTEGSLQRAISLLRATFRDPSSEVIRTFPRHGYRFVAPVIVHRDRQDDVAGAARAVQPRYATSEDTHIAYHTVGEGEIDLVLVLGWTFPMTSLFALEEGRQLVDRLSALGRVVLFDKRGTGLSDGVKELPTLEQRMGDLRAVLDEVGSERAILLGVSEGGPLSIAFSTAHRERTVGLILTGAFPRMASAPDYPHGWKQSQVGQLRAYLKNAWGTGATVLALVAGTERSERIVEWARSAETNGGSPGAALDLLAMNLSIDVRDRLESVDVPTVVLHSAQDAIISVDNGRYLASRIPGARYIERPGSDHTFVFSEREVLLGVVEEMVQTALARSRP